MNHKYLYTILFLLFFCSACKDQTSTNKLSPEALRQQKLSGAGLSMDQWMAHRTYPSGDLDMKAYQRAFEQKQLEKQIRTTPPTSEWEAIGPKNIGGRTLCLAFHPDNPDIMFAGSAGGGLWKTTTAGVGYTAWERVPIGFPVIGVTSIAIDPNDGNVMYIGTGEVYNFDAAAPGTINRITRGSYGVGLLKTTDGGNTWSKSLDWDYDEMKGIQEVVINPLNSNTVFAATTEGLFRSYNAGASWENSHNLSMAVDIEISPADTSLMLVSYGNMNSPDKGVYRSTNGGDSFQLTSLPDDYTGKTLIGWSISNPDYIYASVADEFETVGLYRSTNAGLNWTLMSDLDVPKYQGWYSHDIAVKPDDEEQIIYVGVDAYRSFNGGEMLIQKSYWQEWDFGQVPVGGPEGSTLYVHADIHAVYHHPDDPNTIFLATDGGIFTSPDHGENFYGRNGSYQTQQFYANFSNSATDSLFAMGGMQDNATAIYVGDDAWVRVIGGDGMCTAINNEDDDIVYGSYQYLGMRRSMNGGNNWMNVIPNGAQNEYACFSAPFELASAQPSTVYAGTTRLYRSDDHAENWVATTTGNIDGENMIFNISVAPNNPEVLYVSTAPNTFISDTPPPGKLFKSNNGGVDWETMSGLPTHTISDIAFDPENEDVVYVTYSGFGVNHLYKTSDGGDTWLAIGDDLPDVPTSTIVVDPAMTDHIYVGNDLGVYWSNNGGASWSVYSEGLPDATMVMHLSISPSNNKLRVATHGAGVYQRELGVVTNVATPTISTQLNLKHFPNPADQYINIEFNLPVPAYAKMEIYDALGREQMIVMDRRVVLEGPQAFHIGIARLAAGAYYFTVHGETVDGSPFKQSGSFIKQ